MHFTLFGILLGVIMMIFFNKFKERNVVIVDRRKFFKYAHNNYWTKVLSNNVVEFWAYSCCSDECWYLGKWENEKIVECEGFYAHKLPWDVQKGALRLFKEFQKSLEQVG